MKTVQEIKGIPYTFQDPRELNRTGGVEYLDMRTTCSEG